MLQDGARQIVLLSAYENSYFSDDLRWRKTPTWRSCFPRENHTAQLLAAFGVFAIGYMMRPIGGAVIGHIGDRLGRRTALTFSVAAMAVPTFLIGLLPGYATLGVAAPILFTLLRMMQGLSTGGEYTSSLVFLVE